MKKFYVILLFLVVFSKVAEADIYAESFQIDCKPELDYLAVSELIFYGKKAVKELNDNSENLYKRYGVMSINKLIQRDASTNTITAWHSHIASCNIDNKNYEIKIKPDFRYTDPCAGAMSISLNISLNGKNIIDNLLFSSCESDLHIDKVVIKPQTDKVIIFGYEEKEYPYNSVGFSSVTNAEYYPADWPFN